MEKSKKKGSIRGRVKKRISKFQYQKAIKNESYYANLSALFLCVSIALGLGGGRSRFCFDSCLSTNFK